MTTQDLTPVPGDPEPRIVDLWDRTESRSVLNLVPPAVQSALLDAAAKRGDLFGLDERDLYKALRNDCATPSPTDNRLRMQFWLEYERANYELRKMQMENVVAGICSRQYFYDKFLRRPEKVAWLMTAPVSYVKKIEEALDFGLDRMRDILELNPYVNGKPNVKLMELQAKITWMLEQRVKGAVAQKIEQKNMNLNVSTTDKQVAEALTGVTMEQLNKKIKELELRERKALNLPLGAGDIEVEATPVHDSDE